MLSEFLLALLFSFTTLGVTAGLLHTQWQRARCAYLTFEAVHARLSGSYFREDSELRIEESPWNVRGEGNCGSAREQLQLFRLDGAP